MRILRDLRLVLFCASLLVSGLCSGCRTPVEPPSSIVTHDSSRWESEIAAFETADRTSPPPRGCIVFVGSSSIRKWTTLATDFPRLPVINRGFGGSELADSVHFADRIITRYAPRQVVIFAGSNDLNAGKAPEVVYGDFVALAQRIREGAPQARISFIAISTSPSRWAEFESVKKANALIRAYCEQHRVDFIDVVPLMLGRDGLPRPDIYAGDQLHLNAEGYALWRSAVKPALVSGN